MGTLWPHDINLIGASLLTACAERRPQTAPPLKVLHALICRANWTGPAEVESQFQAIARVASDGRVTLDLEDGQLRVVLKVNYGIGLVRIVSVSTSNGVANDDGSQ